MSVPAALSGPALATMVAISPLESMLQAVNQNPYFIGMMMLLLNLGGRFINLEVTKQQEQFLQHPWVRRVLIFTVLFVATRNLWVAFWATLAVILLLGYLFNENSALCLFGRAGTSGSTCTKEKPSASEEMTPEEKEILQRLSSKAQRYATSAVSSKQSEEQEVDPSRVYSANLALLR
jgi:hypothetical protein